MAGVSELPSESVNHKVVLQFAGLAQVSELLERARRVGGEVLEFSIHSPNLSDAFMSLTGHELRDPVCRIQLSALGRLTVQGSPGGIEHLA